MSQYHTGLDMTDLDGFTLARIFSYLTVEDIVLSVRLTCKRWKDISHENHLWKMVWNEREAKTYDYWSYMKKSQDPEATRPQRCTFQEFDLRS